MITIHKTADEDGVEWIDTTEVFRYNGYGEFTKKGQEAYFFLETFVRPVVHYFNVNTSTAFGNPDLSRMEGRLEGYCIGKGWDLDETSERILITSNGGRKLYYIEKPCLTPDEIDKRKDIRRTLNEMFG